MSDDRGNLQSTDVAMTGVAHEKTVPLISPHAFCNTLVNEFNLLACAELAKSGDVTHLNEKGARAMAGLILAKLRLAGLLN